MAVDGVSSLQQFVNLASSVSDNSNIRATDKGLSATKLHTWASTNRTSMASFMSALKAEFGDTIADTASVQLKTLTNGGEKPLKAWMVRQTVDEAIRQVHANINVRDKFISGIDPEHSLERTVGKLCDKFEVRDPEVRARAVETAREELNRTAVLGKHELTSESMTSKLEFMTRSTTNALVDFGRNSPVVAETKGSNVDKFDVLTMLNGQDDVRMAALNFLPQCRMVQPEGPITKETLWMAMAEDKMPSDVTDADFGTRFAEAYKEKATLITGSAENTDRALSAASRMKLSSAIDISHTGRAITREDFLSDDSILASSRACLAKESRYPDNVLKKLSSDVQRVATVDIHGNKVPSGITFRVEGGDVYFPFGKGAVDPETPDGRLYRSGNISEYTRSIEAKCVDVCGGNVPMAKSLMSLINQFPLKTFGAQGNTGPTGDLVQGKFNEHMAHAFNVEKDADGSVLLHLETLDDHEVVGHGTMTMRVGIDGAMSVDSVCIEPPALCRQQALAECVKARAEALPEAHREAAVSIVTENLISKGVANTNKADWEGLVDEALAIVNDRSTFRTMLDSLPERIDDSNGKIADALKSAISSDWPRVSSNVDENGISEIFYKDSERNMVSSIAGMPVREVPTDFTGCDSIQKGRPSKEVLRAAVGEQLCEAIPDANVRCLVSMMASQAGIPGSISLISMGMQKGTDVRFWPGQPTVEQMMRDNFQYGYPDVSVTIDVDPAFPGALPDDPVNAGRMVHVKTSVTESLDMTMNGGGTAPLMTYDVTVDIPLMQPDLAPGQMPDFTVSSFTGQRTF